MTQPLRSVVVEGSAKVNVGWRVGAQRPDGYHDVSGLIQTISLSDRLEFELVEDATELVTLEVPDVPELEGTGNLVLRAADVLANRTKPSPVRVTLHKAIPVAAGLGGGSADAAATLVALGLLWGARIAPGALLRLGAEIGSDVPAILRGGLVAVSGRGEHTAGAGSFTDGHLVLGVSDVPISAKDAYAAFDRVGPVAAPDLQNNDLEAAACDLFPELKDKIEAMRGAAGLAFVSGSGPTVVGVTEGADRAESVAKAVSGSFDHVVIAQPSAWGVRLTPAS